MKKKKQEKNTKLASETKNPIMSNVSCLAILEKSLHPRLQVSKCGRVAFIQDIKKFFFFCDNYKALNRETKTASYIVNIGFLTETLEIS